ncbi:MAG: DNA repair protein RecN [FCB group bacterium]|nr:DNA repair protein RecN [FCB group bacterium]
MVKRLSIKNFAIIDELEIDFHPGLTVITGETGSGKSILIQALSVALGAKGTKTMVRSGSERAVVETEVDQTTYRRIIAKSGRIKSYINDEPLSEPVFRQSVTKLVDFHGQHEQQLIMDVNNHIYYLDSYCNLTADVEEIGDIFNSYRESKQQLKQLKEKLKMARERQELLTFQQREILAVNPQPDEDYQLEDEYKTLNHIDELVETIRNLNRLLTESDRSLYTQLSEAMRSLEHVARFDSQLRPFLDSLDSVTITIQDVSNGLLEHMESLDHDKTRLLEIEERLQAIEGLKRKYGGSLEAVMLTLRNIEDELKNLSNLDVRIDDLEQEIHRLETRYQLLADRLHDSRTSRARQLAEAVKKEMQRLNMPSAEFAIHISQKAVDESFVKCGDTAVLPTGNGYDQVEFYLCANPGEQPKPLTEIASGGEISRIMLAIKTVFQQSDPVNTLIFDEIDTGISGVAAEKVAESLMNLARSKQVICITHLPQIASRANRHLHVTKHIRGAETRVKVKYLDRDERVKTIAQLFSGSQISQDSFHSLKTIIEAAHG